MLADYEVTMFFNNVPLFYFGGILIPSNVQLRIFTVFSSGLVPFDGCQTNQIFFDIFDLCIQ